MREREIDGWCRRDRLKGIYTLAHRSNVPLQVYSGETTSILGIGSPHVADGLLTKKRKELDDRRLKDIKWYVNPLFMI
jgi:hypothetical protein